MQQPFVIAPLEEPVSVANPAVGQYAGFHQPINNLTCGQNENVQIWNNESVHNNNKPNVPPHGVSVNAIQNPSLAIQTYLQQQLLAHSLQQKQISALSNNVNYGTPNSVNQRQLLSHNISQPHNLPGSTSVNRNQVQNKSKDFSWILLEGHQLPAILHDNQKYIAVKMIETTILSNFPNIFPEEIRNRPPIKSAKLELTHINLLNSLVKQLKLKYEPFGVEDTMVEVQDFIDFYTVVKKHYPHCADKIRNLADEKYQPKRSGWIQINNTVVPYVSHNQSEFLPVQVLSSAAKLDIPECLIISLPDLQVELINKMCSVLGRNVSFTNQTKFVPLHFVQDTNKSKIQVFRYLPGNDPMKYAKFQGTANSKQLDSNDGQNSHNNKTEPAKTEAARVSNTCERKNEIASKEPMAVESQKKLSATSLSMKNTVTEEGLSRNTVCKEDESKEESTNVKLVTVLFCKKNMLCLIRNSEKYVLLEAIFRVFFSNIPLSDFINATNILFGGTLPECTAEEEQAYKAMYGIPNMTLKSKKLLHLETLENILPQLYNMFQVAFETHNPLKRKNEEVNTNVTKKHFSDDVICID